jgi:DinB superfamily
MPGRAAIDVATSALDRISAAFAAEGPGPVTIPDSWSPREYVWHLVDVVRLGTERLWTVRIDPSVGLVCWDENELARIRQYRQLSLTVGLKALREATETWTNEFPHVDVQAVIHHDPRRTMTAEDIVRRTAHELHHHSLDIDRLLEP